MWTLISCMTLHSTLTPIPPDSFSFTKYSVLSSSEIIWHWCDLLYIASLLNFSISVNDANRYCYPQWVDSDNSNSLSNSKAQDLVSERMVPFALHPLSIDILTCFTEKHSGDLLTLLCPLLDTVLLCLTSSPKTKWDPFFILFGRPEQRNACSPCLMIVIY